jgi:hypothetical protein
MTAKPAEDEAVPDVAVMVPVPTAEGVLFLVEIEVTSDLR